MHLIIDVIIIVICNDCNMLMTKLASLVINILQFCKTIIASWSPEKIINFYTLRLTEPKEKIFYTVVSYGAKKKNLYLAYDSANGLTNN